MNLRRGSGPRVVVTVHDGSCDECARYVESLAAVSEQVREWGGEIVIVAGSPSDEIVAMDGSGVTIGGESARGDFASGDVAASGIVPGSVIVADEWGEVYFASEPAEGHGAPSAEEVVGWVRFVAIQCPECESPEGPWRTL